MSVSLLLLMLMLLLLACLCVAVLGHRRHCREPVNLPVSDSMFIHDTSTFAEEFKERFCALKSEFDEVPSIVYIMLHTLDDFKYR